MARDRRLVRIAGIGALVAFAGWGEHAEAQRPDPHLAYAYPAGCQLGSYSEITLGGQYLKDAKQVYIAGKGVQVEVVRWYRPMERGEYQGLRMAINDARDKLIEQRQGLGKSGEPEEAEVLKAAGVNEETLKEMRIYEQRDNDPKRQPNDQLEEEVTLRVTVDKDAEPGKRELRLLNESSISNPLWLHLGRWSEVRETEPNDDGGEGVLEQLPIVVNGQVMPGDSDRITFAAKKGMKLVIDAAAREVIPYLADAVPGWFQAVMVLSDASGRELAYSDSFYFRQDPVIYFEVPQDGNYTVTLHDSLFRGREDFVYRLTIGELPFVTSVFPLGARTDSEVSVKLSGWNLTQDTLSVKTLSRRQQRPQRYYTAPQGNDLSVRFPLRIDNLPELLDQEPNDEPAKAQEMTTRMIVNGRIDKPGDQDLFRVTGPGKLMIEVQARRLGSPLDSLVTVTDAEGKEIGFNDDYEDKSLALLTHHSDSHLAVTLQKSAPYYVTVTDAQQKGGDDFSYRLYLRAPQPDFELRVTPATIIARPGSVVPITIIILRRDGFAEEVELSLVDAPPGYRLDGGWIPPKVERIRATLAIPETIPEGPVVLEMEGRGRKESNNWAMLTRPAIPAENMMQAFIWYHLVPVEQWAVVVSGRPGAKAPYQVVSTSQRTRLPRGGEFFFPVRPLAKNIAATQMRVELSEPVKGLTASIVTAPNGAFAVKMVVDGEVAEGGLQGNLLLRAFQEWTPAPTSETPMPQVQRTDFGLLPAIPFEIAERKSVQKKSAK